MGFSARKLFYTLPPAWRFAVRQFYYLPLDTWETLTNRRGELTPPKGMIYTGRGDFQATGERSVRHFIEYGNLKSNSTVLDIGSGIGRIAIPLTRILAENGRYEGFDVVKKGVDWCSENITARFPNFRFQYVPLHNDLYRAEGEKVTDFRFPYPDAQFDLIVSNSVFTHMLPEEVAHYFTEISRVLKLGGVCYATFFLFDKAKPAVFPQGFEFPFDYGHYRLMDDEVKSANVAFDETYLRNELVINRKLTLRHLFCGSWRGLPASECKDFQDVVIVEKNG
jgi:SAM-dependent methyltransferase